jgi:HEAT repeat protein
MCSRRLLWCLVFALGLSAALLSGAVSQDAAHWIDTMRDGSSQARETGRDGLIALGLEALPALIQATHDPTDFIRWEAVNALGALTTVIEEPEEMETLVTAIPALLERALTDSDPHTRWRSLWALGMFPDPTQAAEIVPALHDGLQNAADDASAWYAVVALAYFEQPEAAPLLHLGIDRSDPFERWEAVYGLGMVHNDESAALVVHVLLDVSGREVELRQEAAMVLMHIADPSTIPALVEALHDPEPGVRWRAGLVLGKLAGTDALAELEAALQRETDPFALETLQISVDRLHRLLEQEQE